MRKTVENVPVDVEFVNDAGKVLAEFRVLFDVEAAYDADNVVWGEPRHIRAEGDTVNGYLEAAIRKCLRSSGGVARIREGLEARRHG